VSAILSISLPGVNRSHFLYTTRQTAAGLGEHALAPLAAGR